MPSGQRGAVFDDVARCPQNPALVEAPRHIIIRAQDVEIPGLHVFHHKVDGLLRRPGPGRLVGPALGGKPGENESGDQKVSTDLAARRVPQFVLQRFGEGFTPALETL